MAKGKKNVYAILSGLLEVPLRRLAQRLATSIPANSTLRSQYFETAMGIIKQLVEEYAATLSPGLKTTVERATDFGDFFTGALGSERGRVGAIPEPTAEFKGWMKEFYNDALRALYTAKEYHLEEELEWLKNGFDIRLALEKYMREAISPKEPTQQVQPFDWEQWGKRFGGLREKLRGKDKSAAEAINKWRARR